MHLADASCDVVLCQQGIQFFPDKFAVLREMHRVLVSRGRLLLSVWKTASPYSLALGEAVERHVGPEAGARLQASRVVPAPEDLHRLLADAGFRDVQMRPHGRTTRLPSVEAFVLWHLAATPVAGAVAALSDAARAALAKDVSRALQSYGDGDGVAFPDETNVVTAHT